MPYMSRKNRKCKSRLKLTTPSIPTVLIPRQNGKLVAYTKSENKGSYGGKCNRTVCDNDDSYYFNQSTEKYYCEECAILINDANRNSSMDLYGTELCLKHVQE